MKQQYLCTHAVGICFALLALAISPSALLAQDDEGPVYVHLRIVSVIPDKVTDFETLMKERTVAEEAAGIAFRHVFQRQRGPLGSYLIVSPGDGSNVPEVDLPPTWGPAIAATLTSHTVFTSQAYGGTIENGSVAPPTEFMYARIRTVVAGSNSDYEDWQMNTLIPALREAGDTDVRVLRTVLGGNTRTWARLAFVDAMPTSAPPDPDNNIGQLVQKSESMVATSIDYFYRFLDDLSFTAPDS
jgi:hypothetical protein